MGEALDSECQVEGVWCLTACRTRLASVALADKRNVRACGLSDFIRADVLERTGTMVQTLAVVLSGATTLALVLWLFFAASAVRTLRDRGAPVAHWLTVFLAPLGYRPGLRSLVYLLSGRYRSTSDAALSAIDSARRYGLVIVPVWFVVVGGMGALWLARAP